MKTQSGAEIATDLMRAVERGQTRKANRILSEIAQASPEAAVYCAGRLGLDYQVYDAVSGQVLST